LFGRLAARYDFLPIANIRPAQINNEPPDES
jgi:hypothetical protein